MIRMALALLGAFGLTGCLSLAEVRGSSPTRTGEAAGPYLPLAQCVVAKAKAERLSDLASYEVEDSAVSRTARVVAMARYPGGLFYTVPTPLFELTVREPDEGRVKIEARRGPLGASYEPALWSIIGDCAGGKVTVSPPL